MTAIPSSLQQFLQALRKNNNRDWFQTNKTHYEEAHAAMVEFAEGLLAELRKHDHIETVSGKKSLFRIYRDVRFSKDKEPYKTNFGGGFKRATKQLRGGYYFQIEPGHSFVAGGFWGPDPGDLKLIRDDLSYDDKPLRKIIASKEFTTHFGELRGVGVKTAPKGYPRDHPAIDLIRMKQFVIRKDFTDKQVLQKDLTLEIVDTFNAMRPFFDHMSAVLTTDANGLPLYAN